MLKSKNSPLLLFSKQMHSPRDKRKSPTPRQKHAKKTTNELETEEVPPQDKAHTKKTHWWVRDKSPTPRQCTHKKRPTDELAGSLPVLSQFFGMFVQVHDSFANATGLQTLTADDGELQQQAHPHQQYEHQPPSRYHWPSVAHCGSLGTAPRSMQWSNSHMNSSSTPNLWLPKELARFCTYIYYNIKTSKTQTHVCLHISPLQSP